MLVSVAEAVPNLQQPILEIEGAALVISWGRELSVFVRTLQTPSRPHASDNLRALARKAVATRNAEPSMSNEEWAAGFANLVIDGTKAR